MSHREFMIIVEKKNEHDSLPSGILIQGDVL